MDDYPPINCLLAEVPASILVHKTLAPQMLASVAG